MTTYRDRGMVLLSIPVEDECRKWLRAESKKRKIPQGVIVCRMIRAMMTVRENAPKDAVFIINPDTFQMGQLRRVP